MASVLVSPSEEYAWQQACAGKDGFPSENSAIAFRDHMHRGGFRRKEMMRRIEWESLEAYRCRFCMQFHLGHA